MRPLVVFPMAGSGLRFGGTFKPFLTIESEAFIEAAVRPFRAHKESISEFVFVIRRDHDTEFDASARLSSMFGDLPHRIVTLAQETEGPLQTVRVGISDLDDQAALIACDCDHALDVDPLFEEADLWDQADAVVPLWPISAEESGAWSVAQVDTSGELQRVREKVWPSGSHANAGVIGCYMIKDQRRLRCSASTHFSDLLAAIVEHRGRVASYRPRWAEFFGDPERLSRTLRDREDRRRAGRD